MSAASVGCILAKDFRRFCPQVVLIAGLGVFINFSAFNAGATISFDTLTRGAMGCCWFMMGLTSLAVVQDDSVTGDRGGWLARPVSATTLLSAKIFFVWLGLVLPAALTVFATARALHCTNEVTLAVTCIHGGWIGVGCMGFLLLGSLTPSVFRAAVVLIVGAVAVGLWVHIYERHLRPWIVGIFPEKPIAFGSFPQTVASGQSMQCVAIIFIFGACVLALSHQFRRRRWGTTVGLIAALFAGFFLVLHVWTWDLIPSRAKTSLDPEAGQGVTFECITHRGYLATVVSEVDRPIIGLQMRMLGGPAGLWFDVYRSQSRFIADKGPTYTMPFLCGWGSRLSNNDFSSEIVDSTTWVALGAAFQPEAVRSLSVGVLELPRPIFESLRGASGRLETDALLEAYRPEVIARMPLAPGAEAGDTGRHWKLRATRYMPDGYVGVTLLGTELAYPLLDTIAGNGLTLILLNRARGEFSQAVTQSRGRGHNTDLIFSGENEHIFHVRNSLNSVASVEGIDADWMENAELEILGNRFVGMTRVKFVVDGMIMPTK